LAKVWRTEECQAAIEKAQVIPAQSGASAAEHLRQWGEIMVSFLFQV